MSITSSNAFEFSCNFVTPFSLSKVSRSFSDDEKTISAKNYGFSHTPNSAVFVFLQEM